MGIKVCKEDESIYYIRASKITDPEKLNG